MKSEEATFPAQRPVGEHGLDSGEILRIDDPHGVLLRVAKGRVWITEEGGGDDVVLDAGGWTRLDRPGTAVVEAWQPAVVRLLAAHAAGFAARVEVCPRPARSDALTKAPPLPAGLPYH